jgi:hypothetical protein
MSGLSLSPLSPSRDAAAPRVAPSVCDATREALRFAELRVLAAGCRMRFLAVPDTARSVSPLTESERATRLAALLALWDAGFRQALDEDLYRDIAQRNPRMATAFRRRLRRRPRV